MPTQTDPQYNYSIVARGLENRETFPLDSEYSIVAGWKKTRNGFKHVAVLFKNGEEVAETKVNYLNRTWESYEYETVIRNLLAENFNEQRASQYAAVTSGKSNADMNANFRSTAAVAQMGELLTTTPKESNDWKERMLKAGLPGLDIPEGFDKLPEAERKKRLDAVIAHLKNERS
jgi:hypothetical protein